MMQTSPNGAALDALSFEASPKTKAGSGLEQGSEFTQVFDKHVNNSQHARCAGDSEGTPNDESKLRKGAAKQAEVPHEDASAGKPVEPEESEAADEGIEGGNALPLDEMRKMAAGMDKEADGQEPLPLNADSPTGDELDLPPLVGDGWAETQQESELVVDERGEVGETSQDAEPLQQPPELAATPNPIVAAVKEGVRDVTADGEGEEIEPEPVESHLLADERGRKKLSAESLISQHQREGQGEKHPLGGNRDFSAVLGNLPGRGNSPASGFDAMSPIINPSHGGVQTTASQAPLNMSLSVPVQQANWGQAMAERVVWMANARIQQAEIHLHPRELGPIDIKVSLQHEQAHVSFVAQHATTREALEAAMPRLREMFSDNGMQLGHTDVSEHGLQHQSGEHGATGEGRGSLSAEEADAEMISDETPLQHGVASVNASGVDAFA